MSEPSYNEVNALEEKVEPWVRFVVEHEGSEVGDMLNAYHSAVGACLSGQEFGWAYQILTNLRDYFVTGIEDGWWDEMLAHFDEQHKYQFSKYNEDYIKRMGWDKAPSERAKELPSLTDDSRPTSEPT